MKFSNMLILTHALFTILMIRLRLTVVKEVFANLTLSVSIILQQNKENIVKYKQEQNIMQKYQILSVIGEGAYGVVLKCRDVQKKNYVAIKKFKDTDEQEHTKKTTMREVKILKMMNHPNIVELKQAFRKKGIVFLVFQYVQNNLLQVLQKSSNGVKLPLLRKLMYQLVKGLYYLHQQNIIHRDIKPQNLLVSSDQQLKICDFGFARQIKKQKGQQITDYVATRWYRPPQLLVGGDYGRQIDMWAVACIMCELIDGNPLFPGQNQLDQLFLIQKSLGPLPEDLHERFLKNQRFLGMKFPEIQTLDLIDKKYFGKICQKGLSFIKSLLRLNPSERLTAKQALDHPYFQPQRQREMGLQSTNQQPLTTKNQSSFRKQIYTSTTNRKKEYDVPSTFQRSTKYGKIYNKKTNYEMMAQIYKSSNNCKLMTTTSGGASKSVDKPIKKYTYTQLYNNNNLSLEKHHNKDILMKTQMRGFFIQGSDDKLSAYGDSHSKKSTEMTWQSTNQLPFLLMGGNISYENTTRKHEKSQKSDIKSKKTQNGIQKQTFNIKQVANNRR